MDKNMDTSMDTNALMTPLMAKNILGFLDRTTLAPREMQAFNEIVEYLVTIIKMDEDDAKKEAGITTE